MKRIRKPLSLILAFMMIFSSCVVFASAEEASAYVPDYDMDTPVIFIHGMGQNDTFVLDDDGNRMVDENGDYITGWPLELDIMSLLKHALPPLLLSAITRKDSGLSEGMYNGAQAALYALEKDPQGNYIQPVEVPCIEKPFSQMTEEEKNDCYEHIPIQELTNIIGEDMVYYFGYDTFGNVADTAEILHNYINDVVLPQTGADQVTICPISLGGSIAVEYLETYPEDHALLRKVVFFVPAIDGSDIVGDILTDNLSVFYDDSTLYESLLVTLMGDSFATYLVNMLLRMLPSDVLKDGLRGLAHGVVQVAIRSCTQMWALCPTAYYAQARETWLSDDAYASIRDQVDSFMVSRANFENNLNKLRDGGTQLYNIVCYNKELFPLCKDYKTTNADGIIDADSTSMGATFADLGTTLPADYVQAGTYCSDPANHNHISPDRVVDPTTSLLPETTWFFKGQPHELLASNDVAIRLTTQLLCDNNMKNVYSNPVAYPQYNSYRLNKNIKLNLAAWEAADKSDMTSEEIAAVESAIAQIKVLEKETVIDNAAWTAAEKAFENALVAAGVIEDTTPTAFENILTMLTKAANRALNKVYEEKGW